MPSLLTANRTDDRLALAGALTFATAKAGFEQTSEWFSGNISAVSLESVDAVDSAGLALLLHWKRVKPAIRFEALPDGLNDLARLSDVRELLGLT